MLVIVRRPYCHLCVQKSNTSWSMLDLYCNIANTYATQIFIIWICWRGILEHICAFDMFTTCKGLYINIIIQIIALFNLVYTLCNSIIYCAYLCKKYIFYFHVSTSNTMCIFSAITYLLVWYSIAVNMKSYCVIYKKMCSFKGSGWREINT